jgi:hypothetical protein
MGDPARPGGASEPFLVEGRVVTVGARPYRVIKDSEDVSVLFQPEGTLLPRWLIAEQRYLDSPTATRGVTLRLLYTSKAYDVTLFFEGSGESPWYHDALFLREGLRAGWRVRRSAIAGISRGTPVNRNPGAFRGWYVNLQSTYRTPYRWISWCGLTAHGIGRMRTNWRLPLQRAPVAAITPQHSGEPARKQSNSLKSVDHLLMMSGLIGVRHPTGRSSRSQTVGNRDLR